MVLGFFEFRWLLFHETIKSTVRCFKKIVKYVDWHIKTEDDTGQMSTCGHLLDSSGSKYGVLEISRLVAVRIIATEIESVSEVKGEVNMVVIWN